MVRFPGTGEHSDQVTGSAGGYVLPCGPPMYRFSELVGVCGRGRGRRDEEGKQLELTLGSHRHGHMGWVPATPQEVEKQASPWGVGPKTDPGRSKAGWHTCSGTTGGACDGSWSPGKELLASCRTAPLWTQATDSSYTLFQ